MDTKDSNSLPPYEQWKRINTVICYIHETSLEGYTNSNSGGLYMKTKTILQHKNRKAQHFSQWEKHYQLIIVTLIITSNTYWITTMYLLTRIIICLSHASSQFVLLRALTSTATILKTAHGPKIAQCRHDTFKTCCMWSQLPTSHAVPWDLNMQR